MRRYNNIYLYWKRLTVFIAFLAMVGLSITYISWRKSWKLSPGQQREPYYDQTTYIVLFTTVIACFCVGVKYYFQEVWNDYRNPSTFFH